MFNSNRAGADAAVSPGAYGDGDHGGMPIFEYAAASDHNYGNVNLATASASGSADAGTANAPGSDS